MQAGGLTRRSHGQPLRMVARTLSPDFPHLFRDLGQWVCHAAYGPAGYGSTAAEARADWLHALSTTNHQPPEQARRPLMAHLGQFHLTENRHVQQA